MRSDWFLLVVWLGLICAAGAYGAEEVPGLLDYQDSQYTPEELACIAIDGQWDDCKVLTASEMPEADAKSLAVLMTYGVESNLKEDILLDLGARGTDDAVALIQMFDTWAQKTAASPPAFRTDFSAFGRNGDVNGERYLKPLGECVDAQGQRWFGFYHPFVRPQGRFWLTRHLHDDAWSAPLFLPGPEGYDQPKLAFACGQGGFSIQGSDGTVLRYAMEDVLRDSDADGSPDFRERYLGTNPDVADTDGDGVADGKDGNPLTPPGAPGDSDEAAIRQAAFTTFLATHWERVPIYVWARRELLGQPQEFHGYIGPVLWTEERVDGCINVIFERVKWTAPDEATVCIGTRTMMVSSGTGREYRVRRHKGYWYVVEESGFFTG